MFFINMPPITLGGFFVSSAAPKHARVKKILRKIFFKTMCGQRPGCEIWGIGGYSRSNFLGKGQGAKFAIVEKISFPILKMNAAKSYPFLVWHIFG
jgi:hypothetical protein